MSSELYPELYDLNTVEMASAKDKQFFLDHPGAKHYIRKFIPGEAPLKDIVFTKVTQIFPGVRARQFFYKNGKVAE